VRAVRIIGPGRAGCSLSAALNEVGWDVVEVIGHADDLAAAAVGVDVLVIATPDDVVAEVARSVRPESGVVVLHLSGSLGLEVLAPHRRRAALHPLVPLPNPQDGARRLLGGVTFAVAGDPVARLMAESLGGRTVEVADADRAAYHAAASIAANHVVALLGQVERVAATAGLPLEAFLDLTRAAVDDVARLGPRQALTGPAARGDWATLARHLDALAPEERAGYTAGVGLALQLTVGEVGAPSAPPDRATPESDDVADVEEAFDVRIPGGLPLRPIPTDPVPVGVA
jgi:predicted short-subunit dehydrogenase-like oxidoreductase (DUF2520 family)